MRAIETIKNIWKIEDLRKRIITTILLVLVYRAGTYVVLPGIDPQFLTQLRAQTSGGLMQLLDMFSGGAFSNASIFALGIMPYITASIVIQGVKSGMNPELTTMWTALGYPPTSVAIPLWVKMGKEQSALVTYDASYKTALLDWYSVQLQKNVYSIHRGNGQKYLHWQLLWNDDQSGYIQQLRAVENRIFDLFDAHKTEWEQNGLDTKEIQRLYKEVDKLVNKAFLGLQKS